MKHDDDYLFDKSGEPDPDVVKLESALAPLRYEKPAFDRAARAKPRRRIAPIVTFLGLAAMVLVYFWFRSTRPPEDGLAVTRLEGTPRIATLYRPKHTAVGCAKEREVASYGLP